MAFSDADALLLEALLAKVRASGWPLPRRAFNAVCETFIMAPVELALVRDGIAGKEIYLAHRHDEYFSGWHLPGSVMRPGEQAEEALARMVRDEIGTVAGKPELALACDRMKGSGAGECPRGQEVARVYIARYAAGDSVREGEDARFISFAEAYELAIPLHKPLMRMLAGRC